MTAKVERIARPLRHFVTQLAGTASLGAQFAEIYAPRVSGLGFRLDRREAPTRHAWALTAQWLVGYSTGAFDPTASLGDADEWFMGGTSHLAPRLGRQRPTEIAELIPVDEAFALLPYLLDALAPGTRRHVLNDARHRPDRWTRKQQGVYYTPADLADWMTRPTLEGLSAPFCLDPACGSGVFLRAALSVSDEVVPFGCDIDPLAAEQCTFVLLATSIAWHPGTSPWAIWHLLRRRVAVLDSLLLSPGSGSDKLARRRRAREVAEAVASLQTGRRLPPAMDHRAAPFLADLFPELAEGCDVLLSNPPYARMGAHPQLADVGSMYASFKSRPPSSATNTYLPFLEQSWRLTNRARGRSAVVVPLSVTFGSSSQLVSLRREMSRQLGRWEIASFDRAPDALFGDDVKTRNAVVRYSADQPQGIATTRLLRWTSRNRKAFFGSIWSNELGQIDIDHAIPKLGSASEAALYVALRASEGRLGADLNATHPSKASEDSASRSVYVASTAYNWLSCLRDLEPLANAGSSSAAPLTRLCFRNRETADAAFALIASRLTYWLWHVECDGFHVPQGFIQRLPWSLSRLTAAEHAQLAAQGRTIWSVAKQQPRVSINKGKRTLAFPAADQADRLDELDAFLLQLGEIPPSAAQFDLRNWYESTVIVDAADEKRLRLHPAQGGSASARSYD